MNIYAVHVVRPMCEVTYNTKRLIFIMYLIYHCTCIYQHNYFLTGTSTTDGHIMQMKELYLNNTVVVSDAQYTQPSEYEAVSNLSVTI